MNLGRGERSIIVREPVSERLSVGEYPVLCATLPSECDDAGKDTREGFFGFEDLIIPSSSSSLSSNVWRSRSTSPNNVAIVDLCSQGEALNKCCD